MFCVWGPLRAQVKGNLFNTVLLLPTFEEGKVCFCVLGALTGPKEGETFAEGTVCNFFNTGPLLPKFGEGICLGV